jgi:hypothetical protein
MMNVVDYSQLVAGLVLSRQADDRDRGRPTAGSVTYIGSIERGERNLSLHNVVRLAAALEISGGELVDGLPVPKVGGRRL